MPGTNRGCNLDAQALCTMTRGVFGASEEWFIVY